MSDPYAGTTTRNLLQHIVSPKIVGPTGGTYSVKTDLVNIDTINSSSVQTQTIRVLTGFDAPAATTGYAGINNSSNSITSSIKIIAPTQLAQNTSPTGTIPKYPCYYVMYASSGNGGGLTQDCFDIFAYPGGADYTKIGTNDVKTQDQDGKWYTNPIQQGLRIKPYASSNATGTTSNGKGFNNAVCLTNPGFLDGNRVGTFSLAGGSTTYTTPNIPSLTPLSKIVIYLVSGVLTNTTAPTYSTTVTEDMTQSGGTMTITFSTSPSTNSVLYGYTIYD